MDIVKMPFGLDLSIGATHGAGTVVLVDGVKMLQVPLWRSYLAGCILLGIASMSCFMILFDGVIEYKYYTAFLYFREKCLQFTRES